MIIVVVMNSKRVLLEIICNERHSDHQLSIPGNYLDLLLNFNNMQRFV
jgi:hypothetical protein